MTARHYGEDERARLAKQGHALPDGSYPMDDCDAVKRAHQAYGRAPASHRAAVRRLANRRNRELSCGLEDL